MEEIKVKGVVQRESGIGWRLKDIEKEYRYYDIEILRGINNLFNSNYKDIHLREGDEVEISIKVKKKVGEE